MSASIFGPLAEADISVDMIVQNISADGETANITFTLQRKDLRRALDVLESVQGAGGLQGAEVAHRTLPRFRWSASACAATPASRPGCSNHLADKGINIQAITTSEIKISVLIDEAYTELAVRALHSAYGLDKISPSAEVGAYNRPGGKGSNNVVHPTLPLAIRFKRAAGAAEADGA